MKLTDIVKELNLKLLTGLELPDREVSGGYVSDMLSDVIAHAREGNVWVTLQIHMNVIAVAGMKEISAVIIVNGRVPDEETLKKAEQENIPVLGTDMSAFEIVGKLYPLV